MQRFMSTASMRETQGRVPPFSIDITDKVRFGENNVLSVKVDSTERRISRHLVTWLTI